MDFNNKTQGFTLVELIVSMAITCILLLGVSLFFSSEFQGLFKSQADSVNIENQFAVNEIVRKKLTNLGNIQNNLTTDSTAIEFKNKNADGQPPFSYMGTISKNGNKYLAMKDFFIFNKGYHDPNPGGKDFFADSGKGQIIKSDGSSITFNADVKNFSSFVIKGSDFYLTLPDKNEVLKCTSGSSGSCEDLGITGLNAPTDITSDYDFVTGNTSYLFISDSGNGRIIKYKLADNSFSPIVTPQKLKYPTGLAYYNDGTNKWLFVSETMGNKINKIDINNGTTYVVAGEGDDPDCSNSAKFCKLNMPTGLYLDENNTELYIADSGNNRVLKMKDPGIPDSLHFNFILDDNYALDRIEFYNDSYDGSGTYDSDSSNLIGDQSNFNPKTGTGGQYWVFQNPNRLTTFSNSQCSSTSSSFYVNEDPGSILKNGDFLKIGNSVFTFISLGDHQDCKNPGDTSSLYKWPISVRENASSIGDGQTVYFSNPRNVNFNIINLSGTPFRSSSGFQSFIIKTFDIMKGLVETDYSFLRVGNGLLGTDEDTMEIVKSGLNFPTGVTNSYFSDLGVNFDNSNLFAVNGNPIKFLPIDAESFANFDYISDFALSGDLNFKILNSGKLLEMSINAVVGQDKTQIYTINASIP